MTVSPSVEIRTLLITTLFTVALAAGGCASKTEYPPGTHLPPVNMTDVATGKAADVVRTARSLKGNRYHWGGTSPQSGFDCSGLVWYVYRQHGIQLPRVSWQQYQVGTPVSYSQIQAGDLIFYNINKGNKSLHVGIATGDGTFIHAPSSGKRVTESPLNNNYWRKHYIGARRLYLGAPARNSGTSDCVADPVLILNVALLRLRLKQGRRLAAAPLLQA